ncbi:MAG TPA: ABC transporter permease [Terriglobia bacterium]|nr:ABC transporter permease [Terriglobia bacterium]
MRKVWLIIKREYSTRVRTKGFVFGTIAVPIFSIGLMVFSIFLATRLTDRTVRLAIIDNVGGLSNTVSAGLNVRLPNGKPEFEVVKTFERPQSEEPIRKQLRAEIRVDRLDAYLVIDRSGKAEFHTKNPSDYTQVEPITRAVHEAMLASRLESRGVRVNEIGEVTRGIDVKIIKITKFGEAEDFGETILFTITLSMLLYMTLMIYGVITMRSVLEEKTSRIVEILISAVRPFQLLTGKILGVAGVAFTQYMIWIVSAALLGTYGAVAVNTLRPTADFPHIHLSAALLVYPVIYFVLGYLLYASLFAAVGAAASNEQDAQQFQIPIMMPLIFSFVMYIMVVRDPNSHTVVLLSEIPFFSPILMVSRIAAEVPPFWQIGLSIVLLAMTTVGAAYISARIYRVGILMYGKRPSVVELLRWVKYT